MQHIVDRLSGLSIRDIFTHIRRRPSFMGFVLFLTALVLNIALQGPGSFFSVRSFNNLCVTNVPFLLVVLAQGVLLMSGTLDISIGVQLALVNVVTIMTTQEWGIPFVLGCVIGIIAAMVASVILWVMVSIFRLPDLLASFALMYAIRGASILIMPHPMGSVDRIFFRAYNQPIGGIFPGALVALVLVLLVWLYLRRTSFGTNIYAVGANPQSAFAAGISPIKVQFQAFMYKGFVTGIAGVCITLMTASGDPRIAEPWGLRTLAACIVGGLTFGGWGSLACAFFGGGFLILIQSSVYFLFNLMARVLPNLWITTYWHNFVADSIIFLGLLTTIITVKGQRETLRLNIEKKYMVKRRVTDAD